MIFDCMWKDNKPLSKPAVKTAYMFDHGLHLLLQLSVIALSTEKKLYNEQYFMSFLRLSKTLRVMSVCGLLPRLSLFHLVCHLSNLCFR